MISKIFRVSLALVLTVALSVPLSACQANSASKTDAADTAKTTVATYRWENFDDGSDVLSLDLPYIPSNVSNFSFNIILEQGKFASDVSTQQIALSGAIEGWLVENVNRKDDVTVAVDVAKPDGWSQSGVALAQIEVSADAVEIEGADDAAAADSQASSNESQDADAEELTADEINAEKGVEWPTDDENVVIENIDIDISDREFDDEAIDEDDADVYESNGMSFEEDAAADDGQSADEGDTAGASPYIVAAVFADPYFDLEEDTLSFKDGKLTFKAKAVDFVLDSRVDKSNLSVVGSNGEDLGISIDSASVPTSSEVEVVLDIPNANLDALDDASLVLAADANETQSQVKGALKIPDPLLYVSSEYQDDEKAVFTAELVDTNDKMSASDVSVSIDGSKVEDATVKQNDDGTCEVSVPVSSVQSDSVVELSVSNIEDYAGQAVSDKTAVASVEEETSRGILGDIGIDIGKSALGSLAQTGLKKFYYAYINPESPGAVTNNDLLKKITAVSDGLNGTNARLKALYDTVQAGNYGAIINDTNGLVSTIYNQECLLAGKMGKADAAETEEERVAALKELYAKDANQILIDELAVNLGRLYDKIMVASASDNKDLIQTYDEMCSLSYNWASQTYDSRQRFRNELALVWVEGITKVSTVYNAAAADEQAINLIRFDDMDTALDKLINETHKIDETSYKQTKGGDTAYYNYTIGKWLSTTLGSASSKGWKDAAVVYNRNNLRVSAETPFTKYSIKTKKYKTNSHSFTTSGTYATTAEVKSMLSRLHGKTLESELKEVGLTTATYLITSERLDGSFMIKYSRNNWYMDTFEIALTKADGSGYTHDKQHFDGFLGRYHKAHRNWFTEPAKMFILKYVTV